MLQARPPRIDRVVVCAALFALGCIPFGHAVAQPIGSDTPIPPMSLPYREVYLANPKVSGNNLVGLRWAGQDGKFKPDDVRVRVSDRRSIGPVCVAISTKDGRYSAENMYDLGAGGTDTPGFKSNTRFSSELAAYTADQVSVEVHKDACDSAQIGTLIPAYLGASGPSANAPLLAFVNADPARVEIAILDGGKQTPGTCEAAGTGVQIAYSAQCTIAVPPTLHGAVTLQIRQKERFRTVATTYAVLLP